MSAPTRGRNVPRSRPAVRSRAGRAGAARPGEARSGSAAPGSGDRSRRGSGPGGGFRLRAVAGAGDAPVSAFGEAVADVISGALAAIQSLVLSLALVALPALLAHLVATASGTGPDDGRRLRAPFEIASGIWLLAHGVPVTASGTTLTLVPLGLTALLLFTCHVTARHAARAGLRPWIAATASYTLGTTAVALATPTVSGWAKLGAVLAGALVGGLGSWPGFSRASDAGGGPSRTSSQDDGRGSPARAADALLTRAASVLPDTVAAGIRESRAPLLLGVRVARVALLLLAGASAVLVGVWAVAGRATSSDIITALDPGWAGGVVLAVAQLVLLPDLVLWATAWLSGAGFSVGTGTSFTPLGVDAGPLPALPLLAALPAENWTGPLGWAVPLVVVGCGAGAGWYAWRGRGPSLSRWRDVGLVLGGMTAASALVVGGLQTAASGAAGRARLAEVGAQPWLTAFLVAAEFLVGAALVLVTGRLRPRPARGAQ